MDVSALHGDGVRTALRFVSGAELAGAFRAADLVVLPYREIDQSGVLFTALAFGKPLLLSAVGGFPEIAATGAAELVAPGDAGRAGGARSAPCSPTPTGWRGWPPPRAPPRTAPTGGTRSPSARWRSTRGSRRRPAWLSAPSPSVRGAGRRSPVSRKPVRSATRCDGWLSSWISSSISSSPSSLAHQSRSSVTAREATPRPRADAATQ